MKKNVYSVGQVNQYIRNMFAQDFLLKNLCVQGEISNWKRHTSGHIFFSLKDKTGVISAVMFAGEVSKGLPQEVKDGDEVMVTGSVRVYEKTGHYQLYAREITLAGAGLLYQRFEALKKELEEMGMFAQEYKQPIPVFPKTVGVVTAPTGAAIRDIQNISSRRNPYVQMILYPAQVQGEGAAESVAQGIRALEAFGVDVIIIGRGGGSLEDLWAFNEEILARQIFDCSVPVVSAVGHETDTTIADFVADLRAPTPSAAAELVVPDIREILNRLAQAKMSMTRQMEYLTRQLREQVKRREAQLRVQSPSYQLLNRRQYLAEMQDKLYGALEKKTIRYRNDLAQTQQRLPELMRRNFLEKKHRMELFASQLDAASPLKKLSGGYGYLEAEDGSGIRSVEQVSAGDRMKARLADGDILTEVKAITRKDENDGKQ
ncbi:MAG: exodeoxyribonuclease VII large subunit [Lachnospiraceae bacterium]|nr:exodeoxyribonuclease VII large subunit [Lachnospiraceae bacterium]